MPRKYSLPEFWADKTNIARGTQVHPWADEILRNQLINGWVDTDGVIWPLGDTSGNTVTNKALSDVQHTTSAPTDNSGATRTVPTGEKWEILGIVGEWDMGAAVAARTAFIGVSMTFLRPKVTATGLYLSTAVALTANQEGLITITQAGFAYHNDHGTITAVEEPLLPMILDAGGTISTSLAAAETDDRQALTVYYRRVA